MIQTNSIVREAEAEGKRSRNSNDSVHFKDASDGYDRNEYLPPTLDFKVKSGAIKSESESKIQLTFKNVIVHTEVPRRKFYSRNSEIPETKIILDDVSGTVLPGQFVAILGASGAGKTTLLNYLSGRNIGQRLHKQGSIMLNGVNVEMMNAKMSQFCAFI